MMTDHWFLCHLSLCFGERFAFLLSDTASINAILL
jgi:hypothetical protein